MNGPKTELSGDGLHAGVAGIPSKFALKFFDQHDNPAMPKESFKVGMALLAPGTAWKEVAPHDFTIKCVDEAACIFEMAFSSMTSCRTLSGWLKRPSHKCVVLASRVSRVSTAAPTIMRVEVDAALQGSQAPSDFRMKPG